MKLNVFVILICLAACARKNDIATHPVNPLAKRLHDNAVHAALDGNDYQKAILILDSAIQIDNEYYEAYSKKLFFQFSLRQFDSALATAKQIVRTWPEMANTYVTCGILAEKLNDTISSKKYYAKADDLYDKILDTVTSGSGNYKIFTMYKGINLILMGDEQKGGKILTALYKKEKDEHFKSSLAPFLFRSREEILDNLLKTHH